MQTGSSDCHFDLRGLIARGRCPASPASVGEEQSDGTDCLVISSTGLLPSAIGEEEGAGTAIWLLPPGKSMPVVRSKESLRDLPSHSSGVNTLSGLPGVLDIPSPASSWLTELVRDDVRGA